MSEPPKIRGEDPRVLAAVHVRFVLERAMDTLRDPRRWTTRTSARTEAGEACPVNDTAARSFSLRGAVLKAARILEDELIYPEVVAAVTVLLYEVSKAREPSRQERRAGGGRFYAQLIAGTVDAANDRASHAEVLEVLARALDEARAHLNLLRAERILPEDRT